MNSFFLCGRCARPGARSTTQGAGTVADDYSDPSSNSSSCADPGRRLSDPAVRFGQPPADRADDRDRQAVEDPTRPQSRLPPSSANRSTDGQAIHRPGMFVSMVR